MNAREKFVTLMGGAAMVAGTVGMTAGLAPASAAPTPTGTHLAVVQDPEHRNNYRLAIVGFIRMQQADAVGFINNINNGQCKGAMVYYLYGDDDGPDHIHTVYRPGALVDNDGYLKATSEGLAYRVDFNLRKSFLNEDDGTDEIYAQANFLDSDCGSRLHTSQVISQSF